MSSKTNVARPGNKDGKTSRRPQLRQVTGHSSGDLSPAEVQRRLSDLQKSVRIRFASKVVAPRLQRLANRSHRALHSALAMTFAVTTALRAQPPKRRAQLLKALGCTRVDKASIELAVVNRFWPAADEQPARKLGQNRNSVHALALQEAYRRSVLPEDLVERWSKKGASPEAWAASYRRRKQVGSGGGLSEGRAKPAKRASDSKRVSDIPNKPSSKLTRAKAPTLKLKGTKSTAPVNVNCSNQMIRCIQKASRCIIIVEKGKKDGVIRALEIATLHGSPNSKRSSRTKT